MSNYNINLSPHSSLPSQSITCLPATSTRPQRTNSSISVSIENPIIKLLPPYRAPTATKVTTRKWVNIVL